MCASCRPCWKTTPGRSARRRHSGDPARQRRWNISPATTARSMWMRAHHLRQRMHWWDQPAHRRRRRQGKRSAAGHRRTDDAAVPAHLRWPPRSPVTSCRSSSRARSPRRTSLCSAAGVRKEQGVHALVNPLDFAREWQGGTSASSLPTLDQALVLIGACFDGSGINASGYPEEREFQPTCRAEGLAGMAENGRDTADPMRLRARFPSTTQLGRLASQQVQQMALFDDEA